MSSAVIPSESPEITKHGHSEMWTPSLFSAAIAKETGGHPSAALCVTQTFKKNL